MNGNFWPIASINSWAGNARRGVHDRSGRRDGKVSGRIGDSGDEFSFQDVLAGGRNAETIIRRRRTQMVQKVFVIGLSILGAFLAATLIEWANTTIWAQLSSYLAPLQYDNWVRPYISLPLTSYFQGHEVRIKLIITAIEGDEEIPSARATHALNDKTVAYGCQISADGRVSHFYRSSMG